MDCRGRWLAVGFWTALWVCSCFGQEYRATLVGTITDPTGAAAADAKVTARNDETGVSTSAQANAEGRDPYDVMTALAERSPVGARKLLFNPSLAGGSSLEPSAHIRGAFLGIDLGHTQADIIRAAPMEIW